MTMCFVEKFKQVLWIKLLLFIILGIQSSCNVKNLYNDFNSFKEIDRSDDVIRLYFDREGFLYPKYSIPKTDFYNSYSRLFDVFQQKEFAKSMFESEGLTYETTGSDTVDFETLQDAIIERSVNKINQLSENRKLLFLIHGYNNTAVEAKSSYEYAQQIIKKKYPDESFQVVEVYWDGLHNDGSSLNSWIIWNNAQAQASWCGLGLRRIMNQINQDTTYVLTHSHGAAVITETLFNVRRFKDRYYKGEGREIAVRQAIYDTPKTNFRVAMLVPAIPGKNVFDEYFDRTVDGLFVRQTNDKNYLFINGFNKYDKVVNKFIFYKRFGSTTLGCRETEHKDVLTLFNDDKNIYRRVKFSDQADYKDKREHGFKYYMDNPKFNDLLDQLFTAQYEK